MLKNHSRLVLLVILLSAAAPSIAQEEAKLIGVLKSNASQYEKVAACRQLARIGTKEAVPALSELLGDEKLAHMARYALEPIRDPAVDAALRTALGTLQGRLRLGVIGSLGVRRDAQAVAPLAKLLTETDTATAQAAARALGNIGSLQAAEALEAALPAASGANHNALCEGLFRCAEKLPAQGQTAQAQAIYDHLMRLPQAARHIRAAALRGAIVIRGKGGVPLMLEAIRGSDRIQTEAAVRAAMELPCAEVTAALAEELPKLHVDRQLLVINTLGYRGDASAGAALLAMASKGPAAVRVAAVENLTHLGYAPALPVLAKLSLAGEGELSAAARACLSNFPGQAADSAIQAMLGHKDAAVRSLAIQMIAQRNIAGSAARLLQAAKDPEDIVRLAALKALRERAGGKELSAVLDLLTAARSAAERQEAEGVLLAVCARESKPSGGSVKIVKAEYGDIGGGSVADVTSKTAALVKAGTLAIDASNDNFGDPAQGHTKQFRITYRVNGATISKTVHEGETLTFGAASAPPEIVEAICGATAAAQGENKLALLRSLRTAGGPKALETIRTALADGDNGIKDAARRILCDWPSPDALPLIVDLATSSPDETVKILALRGVVRLAPQADLPDGKKLEVLKQAMKLAKRDEERKLVLSALGNVPTPDALDSAASYVDDPAVKEEACIAAVAIAEKLPSRHDARVANVMSKVAKATADKALAERASALARP